MTLDFLPDLDDAMLEICQLRPRGLFFFLGNMKILKVEVLKVLKVVLKNRSYVGTWEPILATRLIR